MIPGLNGVRAIAFLAVFGLHTGYFQFGWAGVQLFFVLSGFLITDILLRMKSELSLNSYLYKFYVRRFLRIFPLYYFYLLMIFGVASFFLMIAYKPSFMQEVQKQIPYALFSVYNFYSSMKGVSPSYFLLHIWSLSIEEQFYLFWPLVIFLTPEKALKNLFVAGIVAGPLFRLFFYLIHQMGFLVFLKEPAIAIYTLPFSHVDAFAFGAYVTKVTISQVKKKFVLTGSFLLVAGFLSQYIGVGSVGDLSALGYPVTLPNAYQFIWAYSLINCVFALFIYCVVHMGFGVGLLESRAMNFLGKISYGLYLYHLPAIWLVKQLKDARIFVDMTNFQVALLSFLLTLGASTASFYIFENPIIQLKDKFAAHSVH